MPDRIFDRIVVLKQKLGVSSTRGLEKGGLPGEEWVISNGLLSTWMEEDPAVFVSNKLEAFLNHWKVNREWWRTGKGEVLLKNGTYVKTPMENPKSEKVPEEIYRDLVEANSDYRLIPKTILDDYDILPKKEIENRNKMMDMVTKAMNESKDSLIEKYELIIKGLDNQVARLENEKANLQKENEDLLRQIPAKKQ